MKIKINTYLDQLSPILLEITDQSYLHTNHFEQAKAAETHFKIKIVSKAFNNLSLIKRHKIIYNLLAKELATSIHALSLNTISEDEFNK